MFIADFNLNDLKKRVIENSFDALLSRPKLNNPLVLPQLPPMTDEFLFGDLPCNLKRFLKNSKPRTGDILMRVIELVCNLTLIGSAKIAKDRGDNVIKASDIRRAFKDSFHTAN